MDDHTIRLVEESWERLAPEGPALARAFYARLFELDPRIEDLFVLTEMESQGEKFLAMVGELILLLKEPERFEKALVASGRRHRGYGVVPEHYRTVGEALLWAIESGTGPELTDETREAWAEAYTRMAFLMQREELAEGARD